MYSLSNDDFNNSIKNIPDVDVIITDPPYGLTNNKEDIAVNLTPLFSIWGSTGIGKKRGFEIEENLLLCHGACHNDTIITVEQKNAR